MSYNFRPYDQAQIHLLPESLDDWVSEDSFARFLSEVVDHLWDNGKLKGFCEARNKWGKGGAAFHPALMLKLLLFCYCQGVMSSRKIAQGVRCNVELRYLTANQLPRYRAIAEFRKQHLDGIQRLFVDVLALCQEAGLAKMGKVALDGRRVQGNASLDKNRTKESLQRERDELEKEVQQLLHQASHIDESEDAERAPTGAPDDLPIEFRSKQDRLRRITEAHQRLVDKENQAKNEQAAKIEQREREEQESGKKKRGRKPKRVNDIRDESKANTTDPESRILKTRKGYVQGYNGQAMADCESQVIVAQDLTQQENDVNQLQRMLQRCEEQAGRRPEVGLFDAGYWSEENALAGGDTELYIATLKDHKQRKAIKEQRAPRGRKPKNLSPREEMERKLLTKAGKETYKLRGSTIEPVFGQMSTRGLNRFLLRGVEKVKAEWSLWCTCHNILKLWSSGWSVA